MTMRALFTILIIISLVMPAYASPLDPYIQNLTAAGNDYAARKISSDELECSVFENQYLMLKDKNVDDFISSTDISEIRRTHDATYNEPSQEYEEKKVKQKKENPRNLVLDRLQLGRRDIEQSVIIYYNLQDDRPFVIYSLIDESKGKKHIYTYLNPTSYGRYSNEGFAVQQYCLRNYLKPWAQESIDNATQLIASAKKRGIDTGVAEERLRTSKEALEKDQYVLSQWHASQSIQAVEASIELSNYRSLSDKEKETKLVQEWYSNMPKGKTKWHERISDEFVDDGSGANKQYNIFLNDESNTLYSFTHVVDFNNRTQTFYYNQLIGESDYYIGMDAKTYYELLLMQNAEAGGSDYEKRYGIGILKGEIKIRPFWKFYQLLSKASTNENVFGSAFVRNITPENG